MVGHVTPKYKKRYSSEVKLFLQINILTSILWFKVRYLISGRTRSQILKYGGYTRIRDVHSVIMPEFYKFVEGPCLFVYDILK